MTDVHHENENMKQLLAPFRIDQDTNVDDCEALIARAAADGGETPLVLATRWRLDSRPGGVAAGAQTIISWAQSQSEALLILHAQASNKGVVIRNICGRYHGIVAAMMAGRIVEVDGTSDITKAVYEGVRIRVVDMDRSTFRNAVRGQSLSLFCIDHSSLRFLRPFYNVNDYNRSVRSAEEFKTLFEDIIPVVSPRGAAEIMSVASDLAMVLHELFTNTHVHARTDASGNALRRSVRGVTFAERLFNRADPNEFEPGSHDYDTYLRLLEPVLGPRMKLFELSIFDSGPGLAAHLARKELPSSTTLGEEASLVRKCFLRNVSSRSKNGLGMGLPRVMSVLKRRGGFLRLRTGRLSLVRFFDPAASTASVPVREEDLTLLDSDTLSVAAAEKGRAVGTAITILVPIGIKMT